MPLSRSDTFDDVRKEWRLETIEVSEEWRQCPCGQRIKDCCYLRNRKSGEKIMIGANCASNFMKIRTGALLDGIKRIAKDPTSNANAELIEHAWKRGYLFDEREYQFLKDTAHKRALSPRQLAWKEKANRRILAQTFVRLRSQSAIRSQTRAADATQPPTPDAPKPMPMAPVSRFIAQLAATR